jgi:hypothetical protein
MDACWPQVAQPDLPLTAISMTGMRQPVASMEVYPE